ncbi:MAG TPA: glycosyltransferase family 1 protein [Candidatus Saccharimonadales bacterium]|nr:glycosyltransferase family 1 protein [Candidatus Saccharimonadales bacterium]
MKIGVDAGCLGINDERLKVGVYQVVKNLLIELGKIDKKNEYLLYTFIPIQKDLLKQFGPRMKNVLVTPAKGWMKIWLPLRLILDKPKVFLALNQAAPFRFFISSYKIIGLFYDIAFERYPDFYSLGASVSKHKKNSQYLAKTADVLIAISQKTKEDLIQIYKIPEETIIVSYPGFAIYPDNTHYAHKNPYFLFVGAFKKSKNIPTLMKAFEEFLQKSKKPYDLVLVGGDKWLDPEIEQIFNSLSFSTQKRIKMTGYVSDNKLASLYKEAAAFVSPSLYEGFGLPFVEAMHYGCPVIASDRGSLPEVIKDAGILVDPDNEKGLARALMKVTEPSKRKELIEKGKKRSTKFGWKMFANTVKSELDQLA